MQDSFHHRRLRTLDKSVHRLGLALNYGVDANGVARALERGINYVFYTRMRTGKVLPVLKDALRRERDKLVVSTVATIGFVGPGVRSGAEGALRRLGTDYLDVYMLPWLGVGSAWTRGTTETLVKLREEGKVRAIGVTIHDRERAGLLARDSPLDLLMIRYNAAHPGAERDIFPHLGARNPNVVAYTATSWRKLLKAPRGWDGRPMTAGECYRFCLASPHVDVVLTGPRTAAELDDNLAAVEAGPLSSDELAWMRRFGAAVHG
jgi:aryl-alcohol dehydrogenase-like predicted oxidoreductase